jgi:hypothetical protein
MQDEKNPIKKVCFREAETEQAKVLFGVVTDKGDFIEVKTTKGSIFTINKRYLVFIKEESSYQ